jgi:thymidine phosphorylase
MAGTLFFVVGASGTGKDTLLGGAKAALAGDGRFVFARRTITRAADIGNEGHRSVTDEEFDQMQGAGGFLTSWRAHGLQYGVPAELAHDLAAGRHVVANGSRAAVPDLIGRVENCAVIEITAAPALVVARLVARRREDTDAIAARVARTTPAFPTGIEKVEIANDTTIEDGVARLVSALLERAFASLGLSPQTPINLRGRAGASSGALLRAKIAGRVLDEQQYRAVIGDIVAGRYSDAEVAAFLVAATRSLTLPEVVAIAKVRAEFARRMVWDEPVVVDKHSLGGVPGSRITLIVVPIIAAHGIAIPKTSSRAITSATGTAEAMATVASVDLSVDDVRRVVSDARGCIAWNGRLNHSAVDDVMNAITRPLGLDSALWSVASIMSKKLAAGSTHVIIDLPYGKHTKLKSKADADSLADVFRQVGHALGLGVEAHATDGGHPIGRGVGPALEVRDVLDVLEGRPSAAKDLRSKSLFFAARILQWDKSISSLAQATERAEQLLSSGAAKRAFERIVDAQGRRPSAIGPGRLRHEVRAKKSGAVTAVNGWTIAGVARRAGAPGDPGAGLDLVVGRGDTVKPDDPLYVIHANSPAALAAAADEAENDSGIEIR